MITRREFLGTTASLAAQGQGLSGRPRNVVFVLGDDLGYADVGCYGQRDIQTPHIDSLARDGLRFTQVYAGSTVCAPSRCALMTGQHTGHATIRGNLLPEVALSAGDVTFPQLFQRAGYRTGAFGKWGLGTVPDMHALPGNKGFDTFFGYLHQVHAHTYFPDMLWDNQHELYFEPNFGGRKKVYSHDLITERALKFIDDNRDRPFLLYAPFTPPHGRFEAPDDTPYSDKPWPPQARLLASMVTRLDRSVGLILERLRRYGLERDTLVIFTGDNGPGKLDVDNFHSNGPLRGFKRDLYEGGIRVPFIARWPGRIQPGTSAEMFAFWDLLPTFGEMLGQTVPSGIDGVSVLQALLGLGPAPNAGRHFYWEFHEGGFSQAVLWGNWKGVRVKNGGKPGAAIELYDLSQDLGEKTDLAASRPEIARRLIDLMDSSRTPSPYWPSRA